MAIAARTEWDVRTTGDDSNGGGFNTASTGTDYSQQDSPQVTYSDLVINATNTKVSSAANPFTSADVGNVVNVTGGTGFTVARYQVVSVASGLATMDRAVGTAGSTGGSGKLGGAMATPDAVNLVMASGNTAWVQTGTYNVTTSFQFNNSYAIIGYGSSHGDNGSPPTLNMTANSTPIVNTWSGGTTWLHNLILTTSAGTKSDAIKGAGGLTIVSNCKITGFVNGVSLGINPVILRDSYITGCSACAVVGSGTVNVLNCFISGSGQQNVVVSSSTAAGLTIARSVIVGATAEGIKCTGSVSVSIVQSTIALNGSDGVVIQSFGSPTTAFLESNIIYGNAGYGVRNNGTDAQALVGVFNRDNALGDNTSGNYFRVPSGSGGVALTSDPFTDSASGDYSLNSGGGAACKGVGYPGAFPGGLTTGTLDIGAVQSGSGGGIVTVPGNYSWVA
jgi:hypothetical protein